MIARLEDLEDWRLATWSIGPDHAGQQVESGFIHADDQSPLTPRFFSIPARPWYAQLAIARSLRWVAWPIGFWGVHSMALSKRETWSLWYDTPNSHSMTRAIRAQVQTSPRNPYASAPMASSAGSKANSSAASLGVAPGWGRACNPALPSSRTTFIHCLTARVEISRASAISSWVHPACLSSTARYRRFSFQSTLRVRFLFMLAVYQSCVMREPINAAIYN